MSISHETQTREQYDIGRMENEGGIVTSSEDQVIPSSEENETEGTIHLTDVLKTGNVDEIYKVLQEINKYLTEATSAPSVEEDIKADIQSFLMDINEGFTAEIKLYLADGKSRFMILGRPKTDSGKFTLGSIESSIGERNATAAVIEKWKTIKID